MLRGVPGLAFYGRFLASTPPLTLRERSSRSEIGVLARTAGGEILPAHLFFSEDAQSALVGCGFRHVIIIRDPRDVVVSEAHYLAGMNGWHRMSRKFRKLATLEERLELAICGAGDRFPSVERRLERYIPWLDAPDTCVVRYEELRSKGDSRKDAVRRILGFLHSRWDEPALVDQALHSIAPTRSHTFRKGQVGGWRAAFSPRIEQLFDLHARGALIKLGYLDSED